MSSFSIATVVAFCLVIGVARVRRNKFFAVFAAVMLGVHSASTAALWPVVSAYGPVAQGLYAYLQLTTFVHFLRLSKPRMRSAPFRVLVSWPGMFFAAASFLALPWAVVAALGWTPVAAWLPFAVAFIGMVQSVYTRSEVVTLELDGNDVGALARHRRAKGPAPESLRVVQITDPHLGPFMSVARLARICQRAVEEAPDLIVLTGDFLTMESQQSADALTRALAPLQAYEGKVFACFGNHDHEVPELVRAALASNKVRLLVDEATELETDWGPVQILGADFRWREREEHLRALCEAHPRKPDVLRLLLLHDPGAFEALPEGAADLVLSGHTHGGHLGLLSLGLPHTVVSMFTKMPDHGLWARGRDRLYVHRGTGHYGFPLRVGVPAEESVLHISWRPR